MIVTERGPELDIVAEKVSRADRLELREALKKSFGLGSFSNPGGSDENDAGGFAESHSTGESICNRRR